MCFRLLKATQMELIFYFYYFNNKTVVIIFQLLLETPLENFFQLRVEDQKSY